MIGDYDIRFCPHCDEDLAIPADQDVIYCPYCDKTWSINYDYSFEEGRWRDCTTMTERKTQ